MRSLLLSLSIVLAVATAAAAQPTAIEAPVPADIATPPAGWLRDPGHADVVRRGLVAGLPDGAGAAEVEVQSFRPPEPGAQLILSRVTFPAPADPAAIVRARIEDLRRTVEVMGAGGDPLRQLGWQERSDERGRLVEATLEWAHDGNQTLAMVRAVWVKLPDALAEYRVECVMTLDAVTTTRPACEQAMGSILLPPMAQRQPLTAAAPVVAGDEETGDDTAPSMAQPEIRQAPEGVAPVLPDQRERSEPGRDLRPFYVAGGLLVLGAALWWSNQRRKKVIEAEENGASGDDAEAPGPDELDGDLADDAAEPAAETAAEPEPAGKEDKPT